MRIYWPFEDRKYEAWLTKYHLRKNKWRAEYDDGEHEWIDLRQEQDRVQIKETYPGTGAPDQWIDFRHCRDPAKSKGFKVRTALKMGGGREEDEEDKLARELAAAAEAALRTTRTKKAGGSSMWTTLRLSLTMCIA